MEQEKRLGKIPDDMKTIGVIGGLGPQATMDFERLIHKASQKLIPQIENRGYPPMIVYYYRNAPQVLAEDGSIPSELSSNPALLKVAENLGTVSDFLVIPSNTPHIFLKQIEKASGLKVLNMIDLVVEEVRERGDKKVGVLAIGHTFREGLYQGPLGKLGIESEGLPDSMQQRLNVVIFAVMEGKEGEELERVAKEAVDKLRAKKVDSIILGCSELPLLLKDLSDDPDLINPSQLLAEAAVKFAIT